MEEPKLELKKANRQISRLELVKATAAMRTKRRIAEQLEKEKLEALAEELAADNSAAKVEVAVTDSKDQKKGK